MGKIVYVNWDSLLYYDKKLQQSLDKKYANILQFAGNVAYKDLPEPLPEYRNTLFRILDDFNTSDRQDWFIEQGSFEANTIVQIITINNAAKYAIFNSSDLDISDLEARLATAEDLVQETQSNIEDVKLELSKKQDKLISGKNIATINGQSILQPIDIQVEAGEELCTITKPVAINIGGFKPGMSLQGRSFNELFELLLCNTFDPQIPLTLRFENAQELYSAYVGNTSTIRYSSSMTNALTETSSLTIPETLDCAYQKIDNGIITEYGYQINLAGNGKNVYSTVYLPAYVRIKQVKVFDALSGSWVPYNGEFIKTGVTHNVGNLLYSEYRDSIANNIGSKLQFRFILSNEGDN